ncbi:hypothetical protein G7B40_040370 [Aetokthonos hydrillicola Thurmond2011]|jgi:pectate lyase|uniref:DUF3168 domain-containing protein n=1 Tax=Aetokthonos hydrillicola Thurmond2011 TaxID=2712845 RepID=A0AAP5IH52_9CYAN|nr:hypothetical protein [Aetokthonos hydrillicola]MBO3463672.1 hypothetical protein [Aetokthonos hydrillicola CCALA 1050]MDR9900744.1 hypothetical protein [Aetokthonos hydrillicola Thurmond2011]
MPQHIHTTAELRSAIADLLAAELGTFANNQPAIWVEPPSTPKGGVSGGVEVSISRFKNVSSSSLLLNNQQEQRYEWIVVLKLSDRTSIGFTKFSNAIEKMRRYFPRRRETISPYSEEDNLIATFRLSELEVVNSYV